MFYFTIFKSGFLPEALRVWSLCCVYLCRSDISAQLRLTPSANFSQAQQTLEEV